VAYRAGSDKLHWVSDGRHKLYDLERDPLEDLSALLEMSTIRLVVKGGDPVAGALLDHVVAG